jgi:hypothetical protein
MSLSSAYCAQNEAQHITVACPTAANREFARVRQGGFIRSSYLATLLASPSTLATWTTGITAKDIVVLNRTSGSFDPGTPKELKGYGDTKNSNGPRTMVLNINDPDYVDNYAYWNGISNQDYWVPFFATSSKISIFKKEAVIYASNPVADDLEEEVIWNAKCTVIDVDLPIMVSKAPLISIFSGTAPVTTFDTLLAFSTAVSSSANGINATAAATNATQKFEFNKIVPATGLPNAMTINVGGTQALSVTFTAEYINQAFKYTHTNGTVYTGVFTNGTVSF